MRSMFPMRLDSLVLMKRLPATLSHFHTQRGVVLFIALVVLMAMALASIALIRSVDTATQVAGNLGFKQAALQSSDGGSEVALTWLLANKGTAVLNQDSIGDGYYATKQSTLDLTGNSTQTTTDDVDWDGTNGGAPVKAKMIAGTDTAGNTAAYIIHRLCTTQTPVNDPSNVCSSSSSSGAGSTQNATDYSTQGLTLTKQVYYRITTRIAGPKNTFTYIQTIVTI